jgi:hypothetical protein
MFIKDLVASAPGVPIDLPNLQLAIETVEEGLELTRRSMSPPDKAELVVAVYDLFLDMDAEDDQKAKVLRLVKSAI